MFGTPEFFFPGSCFLSDQQKFDNFALVNRGNWFEVGNGEGPSSGCHPTCNLPGHTHCGPLDALNQPNKKNDRWADGGCSRGGGNW